MDLSIKDSGGSKKNVENLKRAIYTSKPSNNLRRGKGMDIVHMLSDELNIKLDENGNTQVHIIKNRKPEAIEAAKAGAKK
jgi:anti-sigma regulatory factor (Ser/Thr protein kinase)